MAGNIGIEYSSALTCVSRFYWVRSFSPHFYLPRIYSLRFYQSHFYSPRLTYCCVNARGVNVNARGKHPGLHDLSASQSEAARSECVVLETATVLGSSSFITDATGYAVQHLQYLPFGETFVHQQSGYDSRYTFSAKEKDDETQYSYFGARYYDADLSVWLSVDPMSDERSWISPYNYCQWNPVKKVDLDGNKDKPFQKGDKPVSPLLGTSTNGFIWNENQEIVGVVENSVSNCYNCHSYAWHGSKGDPKNNPDMVSIGANRWDNSPADDIKEQGYKQLGSDENNVAGDRVIYFNDANSNGKCDDGETIEHSAVVYEVDKDGNTTKVISKMGDGAISINHPDAPGFYDKTENGTTSRAYYRSGSSTGDVPPVIYQSIDPPKNEADPN